MHDGVELLGDFGHHDRERLDEVQLLCGISHHLRKRLLKEIGWGAARRGRMCAGYGSCGEIYVGGWKRTLPDFKVK